ncbi:MAG: thymidine kinase [Candidatus Woesearchaeota archaeon]
MDLTPRIHCIVGPMYSGKSTELLRYLKRYEFAQIPVQVFKPAIDNRYSETQIVDHTKKHRLTCQALTCAQDIIEQVHDQTKIVGIDEAMFFDSQIIEVCQYLRATGRIIYIAALDTNFRLDPFSFADNKDHIGALLAIADSTQKLKSVCTTQVNKKACGRDAPYTKRIADSDQTILVGSYGDYQASCLEHHPFRAKKAALYHPKGQKELSLFDAGKHDPSQQ